jgi:hypothetical protein
MWIRNTAFKDCTVNEDIPSDISEEMWSLLKRHKSVFATPSWMWALFKSCADQI